LSNNDTIDLIEKKITFHGTRKNINWVIKINGPPGVGKSITVWFWFYNYVKYYKFITLWVHLNDISVTVVRLNDSG
jgi:hypothetical protein